MKTKEQIFSEIKGQVCWRTWRGGQSAIFFELGKPSQKPRDLKSQRGTYTLGITPCPWQVFKNGKLLFNDQTEFKKMEELQLQFVNQKVIDIQFDATLHEEEVVFSEGLSIRTYHNLPNDEWHILTPEEELVVFKDKIDVSSAED